MLSIVHECKIINKKNIDTGLKEGPTLASSFQSKGGSSSNLQSLDSSLNIESPVLSYFLFL